MDTEHIHEMDVPSPMVDVWIVISNAAVVDGLSDVEGSTEIASTVTEEFQRGRKNTC